MKIKIRSADARFQQIEAIKHNREKRHKSGKFFVEGVAAINLAIKHNWTIDSLLYSSARPTSSWAEQLISGDLATSLIDLAPELLDRLSDKDQPSEVIAIVHNPKPPFANFTPSTTGLLIVFDRPASPGNLGSVIRSADAFGADAIVISGHAVDPYDPQVVRASVGTIFTIPIFQIQSHKELAGWLEHAKGLGVEYKVVGTSAKAELASYQAELPRPLVLLLGNEANGLSKGYRDLSNELVKIPIQGSASSLNVASAASIFLYEVLRQSESR